MNSRPVCPIAAAQDRSRKGLAGRCRNSANSGQVSTSDRFHLEYLEVLGISHKKTGTHPYHHLQWALFGRLTALASKNLLLIRPFGRGQ